MQQRLRFCIFENNILSELYDSHLLVRGLTNDTLCKLFKSNMLDWEAENNSSCFRFEPKTSLKLDYVFGMETWHTRNSVIYVSNPKRFVYFVSKLVVLYHPV